MAQAPDYAVPTVTPQTPQEPQASPADFGAQIGAAEQGLGQSVESVGDVLAKHAMWRAQIEADALKNNAFTAAEQDKAKATLDFNQLEGQAAHDALPGLQQRYDEINKNVLDSVPNPKVRNELQQELARQDIYSFSRAAYYAASQSRTAANGAAQAKVDLLVNQAPPENDAFQNNLDGINKAVDDQAKLHGWSADQTALEKQQAGSRAWSSRVLLLSQSDPKTAYQMFQDNKDKFSPEAQLSVGQHLAGALNALGAKQAADQAVKGQVPNGPLSTDLKGTLALRESGGNYTAENTLGFAGRYQFGAPRLNELGLYTVGPNESLAGWNSSGKNAPGKWSGQFNIPGFPEVKTIQQFLASPGAQEKAWEIHDAKMDQEIKQNHLDKFEGQTVQGVFITHDGIKAMMHLGGIGGARDALTGHGGRDDYGTTVLSYARLGLSAQANDRIAGAFGDQPQHGVTYDTTPEQLTGIISRARADAQIVAPNDATYADNVESDIRRQYNVISAMHMKQLGANYQSVLNEAVPVGGGQGPTSVDQLSAEARSLYYNLPPDKRKSIKSVLTENSKIRAAQPTDKSFSTYHALRGMWETDPAQFAQQDIASNPDLTPSMKHELIGLQTNPKPPTAPRFDMSQAMQAVKPALDAVKLTPSDNAKGYGEFYSRYSDLVKRLTDANRNVLPGDDVLQKAAAGLLRVVKPGYFSFSTTHAYDMTIDDIPEEDRFYITKALKDKFGVTPDPETVIDMYNAAQIFPKAK